jgi:putative DNA primase/helicase
VIERVTQEQINNIPKGLKILPRWVGFMLIWNDKKGKNDKIPINSQSLWGASTTNSGTWGTFEQVLSVIGQPAQCHRKINSIDTIIKGKVDGMGFVLGDGICGIDLDRCIDGAGQLTEQAQNIVETMDGTYLEYSPSGTGLHFLFRGSIPAGHNKSKDGGVEMYSTGRFFTVTGNGAGELQERTGQAADVFNKYMNSTIPMPQSTARAAIPLNLSDSTDSVLLEKMFSSKNGAAICALWNGDTSAYGGDDSRADSALVMHLLFWTHGDADRTDRLFRQSGLMRDKWDERHGAQTYGELTIARAIESQRGFAVNRDFAPIAGGYSVQIGPSSSAGPIAIDPLTDEKRYPWNDTGNGALFADTYKNMARYVPQAVAWYVYENGVWKIDDGGLRVAELAKALVRHMISCAASIEDDDKREKYLKFTAKISSNKSRDAMQVSARSIYPVQITEFDKNPYLFNCLNGTFNLKDFTCKPHDPLDMLSKIANVNYDPKAKCGRFVTFVNEIMENDAEKIKYLQTAIGYSMTGLHNKKCFFILHGKLTNNGKSTFMDAVMNIMGDYAKAAQADVITSKQYAKDSSAPSEDIARLSGARLVSMAEPDKSARLNVGLIKQMTGNDPLTARFLRQNSFQFMPQFKIFLHANDLPQTTDDTIFASGRVKIIEFNREFTPQEQDSTLETKFKEPESAAGIFNWMLKGVRSYLCEGLTEPVSVQAAIAAYRADSDIVGNFIGDCLEPMPGKFVLASAVYQKYQIWCARYGYQAMSFKNLNRELRRKLEIQHTRKGYAIYGYRINDSYFSGQDFYENGNA